MAGTREYAGLGRGDSLVKPVAGVNLAAVRLTAQEGFVYSRVDGTLSIDALCLVTGLGDEATAEILRRLRALGLIEVAGAPRPRPVRRTAEQTPVPPRRETPPQRVATRSDATPREATRPETPKRRSPSDETARQARPESFKRRSPSGEAPAFPTDPTGPRRRQVILPEDESGIDLKPEVKERIRKVYGTLQERNFFELLEVSPHADTTELKRAYFQRSKEFHPDRFFSRQVGAYKDMLDEIFKQISAAYRFLDDEEQRGSYREMVLQDMEQASALRKVEEQAARAINEDAAEGSAPVSAGVEPEPRETGEPEPAAGNEYRMSRSDLHRAVSEEDEEPARPAERPSERVRRPSPFARSGKATETRPAESQLADESGSYSKLSPEQQRERDLRREEDRKRRMSKITSALMGRAQRAQIFYEQGLRQLAANQALAAAASLKLAVTFGGDNPAYRRAYDEAAAKSSTLTAENFYKRGIFEESVGRMELAGKHFIQAAEALPTKVLYLYRAAEAMLAAQDLIKAKDYATRAVQVDGSSVDARIALARVYDAVGMKKNARRELQHALKLDPGNTLVKDLLKTIKD